MRERAYAVMKQGVKIRDPDRFDLRGELICGRNVEIDINVMEVNVLKNGLLDGTHSAIGLYSLGGTPLASLGLQSAVAPYNWARWSPPGFEEMKSEILEELDSEVMAKKLKALNIVSAQGYHNMQLGTGFGYNAGHSWLWNWWGEFDIGHALYDPIVSRMQIVGH